MAVPRAAMIQFSGSSDKEKNISKARRYVIEAADNGAQIVCLQELFNTIYFCYKEDRAFFDLAEPIPGPTIEKMCDVAAEKGIVLVAPIFEKTIPGEYYNTAVVIGANGDVLGKYRKISIPYMKAKDPDGFEKFYFKPGNLGFPVFPTPCGVNIGVMLCYDRHFPEHARALALNGAELLFAPSATCGMTDYLWQIELQAHAIENILYVGGVNRVGKDEGGSPNQYWYGSSFFADPKGQIISRANDKDEGVVYADIDLRLAEELRNTWHFFRDRRPDQYGILTE